MAASFSCPFWSPPSATPPSVFAVRTLPKLEANQGTSSSLHPRVNLAQPRGLFFCRLTAMHGATDHVLDEFFLAVVEPTRVRRALDGDLMPCRVFVEVDIAKD